jgi:uncharacterized membrane protein YeaQ/YmgE (transglycosylase-associated protein family)
MESTLTAFSSSNLNIKLTDEKLFINTSTSSEAFALRSINGIGVIDLVDEYNKKLTDWKSKSYLPYVLFFCGIMCIFFAFTDKEANIVGSIILGIILAAAGYFLLNKFNKDKPSLQSAVRIMMSGGNRDFSFDKAGVKSDDIAQFVAKVESTLTAYNK